MLDKVEPTVFYQGGLLWIMTSRKRKHIGVLELPAIVKRLAPWSTLTRWTLKPEPGCSEVLYCIDGLYEQLKAIQAVADQRLKQSIR